MPLKFRKKDLALVRRFIDSKQLKFPEFLPRNHVSLCEPTFHLSGSISLVTGRHLIVVSASLRHGFVFQN